VALVTYARRVFEDVVATRCALIGSSVEATFTTLMAVLVRPRRFPIRTNVLFSYVVMLYCGWAITLHVLITTFVSLQLSCLYKGQHYYFPKSRRKFTVQMCSDFTNLGEVAVLVLVVVL
jgi:hypothetical protein